MGQIVLFLAADAPFLDHFLGAFAHGFAHRVFGNGRRLGQQVFGLQLAEQLDAIFHALGKTHIAQHGAQFGGQRHPGAAGGVGAPGNGHVGVAGDDVVGHAGGGLEAGGTGAGDGVGVHRIHPQRQGDFPGDKGGFRDHHRHAEYQLLDIALVQVVAGHQFFHDHGAQVDGVQVFIVGGDPGKRGAQTIHHGHAAAAAGQLHFANRHSKLLAGVAGHGVIFITQNVTLNGDKVCRD